MSENRSSLRFIVSGFAIIAILALSVAAENSWGGNFFGSIREFLGVASSSSSATTVTSDDLTAISPGNGKITFQRGFFSPSDKAAAFIINPATGTDTALNQPDVFGRTDDSRFELAFSPDGKQIAYSSNGVLSLMNADGTNGHPVGYANGVTVYGTYPAWSPDGVKLVYIGGKDNNDTDASDFRVLWTVNIDGSGRLKLTNYSLSLIYDSPSWGKNPVDGSNSKIAFSCLDSYPINNICTINSDGSGKTAITNSGFDHSPKWSRDGSLIVFDSGRGSTGSFPPTKIYTMDGQGSNVKAITTGISNDAQPAWSPDGKRIVFSSIPDGTYSSPRDLYMMNADGTGITKLNTTSSGGELPDWGTATDALPIPTINSDGTGLSPSAAVAGGPSFTLTVNGTNFVNSSAVNFNGAARTTTFVSATKLTAVIPSSDLTTIGDFPITIVNPAPGGGTSNAVNFTVSAMTLSFDGRLRDRVSKSESGLCFNTQSPPQHGLTSPICDGDTDGSFSLALSFASFSKSITKLDLVGQNGNRWDTMPGNGLWVIGLARGVDAPFENDTNGSLNSVPVGNQGTFKLFVPDSNPSSFVQGKIFTLTLTFSDNSTLTATTTVQQSPTWDMGITMRGPSTSMLVGDRFTYSASLQNYGTALATKVQFADQLPANLKLVGLEPFSICSDQSVVGKVGPLIICNFNQLDPGQATTIVLTVQAVSEANNFTNSAAVTAQVFEPSPDPHSNTASVQSSVFKPTDIAVTITGPSQVNSVDKINYTADLVNKSNPSQDAFGVVFTADIPNNATFDSTDSAALGCVGVGTTFTCNLPFAVSTSAPIHIKFALRPLHTSEAALITTKVHVTSSNPDSNLINNDATSAETAVKLGSDLAITMTGPTLVSDGSNATYAIRVTNNGPSLNSGAGVVYQMPSNVDFVSVTPGSGSNPQCGLNLLPKPDPNQPDYVQCSLGPIPVSSTYQVNLTVRPKVSGTIFNIARVGLPSAFLADEFGALAPLFINPDDLDGNPTNDYAVFTTQTCVNGSGAVPKFEAPNPALLAPAGTKYTYRVRATDTIGGGRISYSLAQAPQGMTIKNMGDGTALVEWKPDSSLIDNKVSVSVLASILAPDGSPLCNGSSSKTFQIMVTQPIPPGGYCITNGAVKICSDAIVPASGTNSALAKKLAAGALRPQDVPSGTYQFGGNTKLGDYILFTGSITVVVDRAAATLKLSLTGGSLILKSVPIIGDQTLWSGDNMNFTFDANGKLTQFLQGQTDQLHIAGCTVHITAAKLLLTDSSDLGIDITGQLILPDVAGVKGLNASFQDLRIQQRSGVHFTGQIAIPDFDVGGFGVRQASVDFVASPDGMHDIFSGGGTLITPALTVAGNVTLIGGKLDSVCAAASFPVAGVPLPPIFNISGGGFGISGLQGGPVPDRLCGLDTRTYSIPQGFTIFIVADVTIANPAIANIVKLGHAGLIYTAPNKIAVVSDLDILSTKAASVAIGMEVPLNVSIGAEVSLVDSYQVFSLGGKTRPDRTRAPLFSAGLKDNPDNPGHLIGFMSASAEARVQIPKMPNPPLPQPGPFIYGLAQAAGVKFPIIIAKAGVGFDYPPGAFSADVTFPIVDTVNIVVQKANNGSIITDIGTKFGALPPVTFARESTYVTREQTSRSAKNQGGPQYYPGSEGLHVMQTAVSAPLSLGSFNVPAKAPKLAFDLSAGSAPPRYDLTRPDGTVITPDNASANNAVFLQNADLNESYYVITDPAAGIWLVQAEDGSQGPFVLNTFGANAPPVLTSVSATQTGSSVQITYNATDADDDAPVSLFYSKSNTEFTGTPIKDGLVKSTSGSYTWNTGDGSVPAGDYYVYAFISDGKNVPQTKFATTKITVVDSLAPQAPQGVSVKPTAGNSLAVSWMPNSESNLKGYNIFYAVDLGNGTTLDKSFDAGNQTSVRLPMLANNTPYRVSVVAYSQTSKPDPNNQGSNIVTSHMSTPSSVQTATTGMATPPAPKITAPNGGEQIAGNNDMTISWTLAQDGDVVNQKIEVSTDDGANYAPIVQTLDKTARIYVWHVPSSLQSTTTRIRVTALDSSGNTGSDTSDAAFTFTLPTGTPVSVSGRVVTPDGRGLRNATVSMTDSDGVVRTATTSSFGFFSFTNVSSGGSYTVRIISRLYRFAPKTVQINDNLTLPDFVGLE